MAASHRALRVLALILLGLVPSVLHAQVVPCEVNSVPAEPATFTKFYAYRSGAFGDFLYRDVEFLWDSLYAGGITSDVASTLDRFAGTLVDSVGWNPFGIPASDFNLLYDYFRREGSFYTKNPFDTTSVVLGSLFGYGSDSVGSYKPSDRSHADVYLFNPSRGLNRGGGYRAGFISDEEDISTLHPPGEVKHANALDLRGPPASQTIDLDGTGWTHPEGFQAMGFPHEFQHMLPGESPTGTFGELFSAGAEAVGGISPSAGSAVTDDFPFTWSLIGNQNNGGQAGCAGLRGNGSAYQARSAFAAYLAYNFRGSDTSPTLLSIQDDLLHQWSHNTRTLGGLRDLLGDDSCSTCATKNYFHPGGQPLDLASRLALLLHHWRVANYVNNDTLDEDQYGFGGFPFSPASELKAWQPVDVCGEVNDVLVVPPEVTLTSRFQTRDTTMAGNRPGAVLNYPMVLQPYGSEYWVIRSDPSIWTPGHDLVVRVSADGVARDSTKTLCNLSDGDDLDGRMVASVVAYDQQDESPGVPGELWAHPEWAVRALSPRWCDADSLAGDLEFVVPSFGDSIKAALVVITLADGPRQTLADMGGYSIYKELLRYRLHLGLRTSPVMEENPLVFAASTPIAEQQASWAPTSDSLVYVEDPAFGNPALYIRAISGGVKSQVLPAREVVSHPEWSPRGDKIVFSQSRPLDPYEDLYVLDRASGETTLLTSGLEGVETEGTFRPDGQRIAYVLHRADSIAVLQDWEIRLIGVDGTADTLLVRRGPGANLHSPRWTPDGSWVYFTANDTLYAAAIEGPAYGQIVERAGVLGNVTSFDLPMTGEHIAVEEPGFAKFPVICGTNGIAWDTTLAVAHGYRRLAIRDTVRQLSDPRFYTTGASSRDPRLSPDGTRVVYTSDQFNPGVVQDLFIGQVSYNHAPAWATIPQDVTVTTCGPVTIDLDATDPDGETVTYSAAYLPATASLNSSTGVFTWNPPLSGDHYITFRALDGSGGVAHRVVRISVPDSIRPDSLTVFDPIVTSNKAWISWYDVGDDSLTGQTCKYDVRRNSVPITEANWSSSTPVAGPLPEPFPAEWDSLQTMWVTGLAPSTSYYIAMKVRDEAGDHWSRLSNVVVAHTLGGGGGLSARRSDPGETSARGAAPAAQGLAVSRTAEAASLIGATQALVAEFTRSGEDLSWLVYRLDAGATSEIAGRRTEAQIVLQHATRDGWADDGEGSMDAGDSLLTLHPPTADHARFVFLGDHRLLLASDAAHGHAIDSAEHSRLGSMIDDLAPATGEFEIGSDDSLRFDYQPTTQETSPTAGFLTLRRAGTRTTTTSRQPQGPSTPQLPKAFALAQNQPNPFASTTTIRFDLPTSQQVRLEIFDAQGRRVARLADGWFPAGFHALEWDRRGEEGRLQPGVYLYRIQAGPYRAQKKLVLLP